LRVATNWNNSLYSVIGQGITITIPTYIVIVAIAEETLVAVVLFVVGEVDRPARNRRRAPLEQH